MFPNEHSKLELACSFCDALLSQRAIKWTFYNEGMGVYEKITLKSP